MNSSDLSSLFTQTYDFKFYIVLSLSKAYQKNVRKAIRLHKEMREEEKLLRVIVILFYEHRPIRRVLRFRGKSGTMYIGGDDMEQIEKLKRWVGESSRIVFFGGAGVSTESVT